MKTDPESHAMGCAQQFLWMTDKVAERVLVTLQPLKIEIQCTDGTIVATHEFERTMLLAAIKKDHDDVKKTIAEIKALKRMEDLA